MNATIKDNIIFGGEVTRNITTNFKSLGHLLLERIRNNGNEVMMINGLTSDQWTRKEVYERTVRLAYVLRNLGVKSGDTVGLCSENCFEFAITLIASIVLDATAAPCNVHYSEHFDSPSVDKKETVALILCSSGTAGMTKGVQLTQSNILYLINQKIIADETVETCGNVFLCVLPLSHSFGCLALILAACSRKQFIFLAKFEEKVFLRTIEINGLTGDQWTRKEVYDRTVRLAYALRNLGVKKGDVVGLCSENCFEFAITLFAIMILDATAAPFNVQYSERELNHAVNLSKPKILFGSKDSLNNILAVAKNNGFIKHVFVFGNVTPNLAATSLTRLLNDEKIDSYSDFDSHSVDKKETVSLIMCSSGTTGMPKGVQLTQQNILYILNERLVGNRILGSFLLSVIPWTHSFGCMTLLVSSCLNIQSIFLTKFEEKAFLRTIEKYKVTTAYMVPPLMVFLAKHPIVDQYNLSSLQRLACGAAPLSKEVEDAIKQRIGIPSIRQGYGLTESTVGILSQNDRLFKPGSVGGLTTGLWAKIIDTETGVPLGPNRCGELCFKGDCVMKGYIGDRSATATIIIDGWLHTGDIGYFDEDLEFFIVDRIKELIKYKGYQVPPAEIEALLLTHPKIKDAAVIGLPDDVAGELPLAFVVKQANVELTAEEVIKFVANNASAAKRLRGGVRFLNEIPKNASGKILRRLLRDTVQPKSKL